MALHEVAASGAPAQLADGRAALAPCFHALIVRERSGWFAGVARPRASSVRPLRSR